MHDYILDIKALAVFSFFWMVSFSECEVVMKVIVFFATVGYTVRRWYLLEKNKKE